MTKVRESLSPLQNAIHLLYILAFKFNQSKSNGNLIYEDKKGKIKNQRNLLCKTVNFQPRLKICSRSIHVAYDVANVAHNGSKHKDSKKKHAASEDIFLYR